MPAHVCLLVSFPENKQRCPVYLSSDLRAVAPAFLHLLIIVFNCCRRIAPPDLKTLIFFPKYKRRDGGRVVTHVVASPRCRQRRPGGAQGSSRSYQCLCQDLLVPVTVIDHRNQRANSPVLLPAKQSPGSNVVSSGSCRRIVMENHGKCRSLRK